MRIAIVPYTPAVIAEKIYCQEAAHFKARLCVIATLAYDCLDLASDCLT